MYSYTRRLGFGVLTFALALLLAFAMVTAARAAEYIGAGDIADAGNGDAKTAAIIKNQQGGQVWTAGDNAYESGKLSEFMNYYDPNWGDFKARTNPTPGNHEYRTSGASGYKDYFGVSGKTYYADNYNGWRMYYLDSEIPFGAGSAQYNWVENDLANNPEKCSIGVWHAPRYSSGEHGSWTGAKDMYQLMDREGVDIVLNGHDHDYERFARMDASGNRDAQGIQEFVVGTGGTDETRPFSNIVSGSLERKANVWGVLDLDLNKDGTYGWKFREVGAGVTDSGSDSCVQ